MSVLRQFGWSVVGSLGGGVLAFATQFGASYVMVPGEYGKYSLIVVALTISTLASVWTTVGAVRFGAQEYQRSQTVDQTFSARLWITWPSVLLAVIVFAIAPGWLVDFFELPPESLRLLILPLVTFAVNEHVGMMALAMMRFRLFAVASIVMRLPPLAVVLYALVRHSTADLIDLVIAMGLGLMAGAVAMMVMLGLRTQRIHLPDRERMRGFLSFSTPILLTSIANTVAASGGPVLLRYALSLEAVGTYQLANLLGNVFGLVAASLNRVLLPQFVHLETMPDGESQLQRLLTVVGPASGLYAAVFFAAFATLGGSVFGMVVSHAYVGTAFIVPAVICMGAYRLASCLPGSYGNAKGLTRGMSVANTACALVNLLITWRLIRTAGAAAPAIATAVSEWLNTQLFFYVLRVPARFVVRSSAVVLAPSLYPLAIAGGWLPPSLLGSVLWAVGCLACIPFVTRLLGFDRSDANAALSLVRLPSWLQRRLV